MVLGSILTAATTAAQAVIDFVKQIISWFIDTVPGPIKILLFLFLITNLLFIVPSMLNIFGFHCDSQETLYKIPVTDFVANLKYLKQANDIEIDITENVTYSRPTIGGEQVCSNFSIGFCTNCTKSGIFDLSCVSDGYRFDEQNATGTRKTYDAIRWLPCIARGCAPAPGFIYNVSSDQYECYRGCNESLQQNLFDNSILQYQDAERIAPLTTAQKFDLDNAIRVKCEPYEPQLTLFSTFNIFDRLLWSLLIVIGFVAFAISFKNNNR